MRNKLVDHLECTLMPGALCNIVAQQLGDHEQAESHDNSFTQDYMYILQHTMDMYRTQTETQAESVDA